MIVRLTIWDDRQERQKEQRATTGAAKVTPTIWDERETTPTVREEQQKRKKRWEQQRRQEQRAKDRAKVREQRAKEREQRAREAAKTGAKTINDLPVEMIHEIFDRNPQAGLVLANTNKWFSEVLKDKIKKYRELIRECNSAAVCYSNSFDGILAKECKKARKHNTEITGISYISYFQCLNCLCSFECCSSPFYFLIRRMDQVYETGIVLCLKCTLLFHGGEIKKKILAAHERDQERELYGEPNYNGSSDDSSDDSIEDSDYYSEDEHDE